jgi:hypothetical protein
MKGVACMICHYAKESTGLGNLSRLVQDTNGLLTKSERPGSTENPPSPALSTAQDRKLIAIPTGAAPDSRPQSGWTSHALWWSLISVKPSRRRGRQGGVAVGLLQKYFKKSVKRHF